MEQRPKIKIELTPADKIFEVSGWVILILLWGFVLYNYPNLPDTIPVHFNASGQVNGYGNKTTIFILPVIATLIFTGMTILNKFHTFITIRQI